MLTIEMYKKRMDSLLKKYNEKTMALKIKFAKAYNPVCIGDIVERADGVCIRVDNIRIHNAYIPLCIYEGVVLINGEPHKKACTYTMYQSEITKINENSYTFPNTQL